MDLGDYLAAARFKPWAWREHDCTAFPALWAGFGDALPDYSSELEAEAMLCEAGGMVPLWDEAVAASGGSAEPVALSQIEPGDVGVIELLAYTEAEQVDEETGDTVTISVPEVVECGAIWTGRRWAFVPKPGGIAGISAPVVLKAWRPRCPRP